MPYLFIIISLMLSSYVAFSSVDRDQIDRQKEPRDLAQGGIAVNAYSDLLGEDGNVLATGRGGGFGGFRGGFGGFGARQGWSPGYGAGGQPPGMIYPQELPEQESMYTPPSDPPPSEQLRTKLITALNQALKDPQFNSDFKELIKTKIGGILIKDAFTNTENARYLINMINSGKLQALTAKLTPIPGPLGQIMEMIK